METVCEKQKKKKKQKKQQSTDGVTIMQRGKCVKIFSLRLKLYSIDARRS